MADNIETHVMLLTANLVMFIIIIGGFAGKLVGLVIGAMFVLILLNLYKISPEAAGLRKEILKNKRILLMQKKKLEEQKLLLDGQRKKELGTSEKERAIAEASKISGGKPASSGMRLEHWKKIEKELAEAKPSADEVRMAELKDKRDEIQNLIELSKNKYHQKVLDEASFREITKDYQRKLIEVESEIERLEGKEGKG